MNFENSKATAGKTVLCVIIPTHWVGYCLFSWLGWARPRDLCTVLTVSLKAIWWCLMLDMAHALPPLAKIHEEGVPLLAITRKQMHTPVGIWGPWGGNSPPVPPGHPHSRRRTSSWGKACLLAGLPARWASWAGPTTRLHNNQDGKQCGYWKDLPWIEFHPTWDVRVRCATWFTWMKGAHYYS